jgi:MFS family permease
MSDRAAADEPAVPAPRWSLAKTFGALQYPNYRRWFFGQLVSLFGTWMQTTAEGYLVFELTRSPAYLGYVGFAGGLPVWLFTLYGGVVADRLPRRTLLVITQTAMMLLAFGLAALVFLRLVQPWHIVVLAGLLGVATAFDAPARQSFVIEMVERESLTNAVALNSTMYNLATAIGPAVAGVTYALVGPAWCFVLNGFSFLAVIGALLSMRFAPAAARPAVRSGLEDLKEGLRYVSTTPMVRILLLVVAVSCVFGLAYYIVLPAWAVIILGGDATTNGLLLSARGVGALTGALMIASLGPFKSRGRLLAVGQLVFPIMLLLFAGARWLPLSLLLLVGAGWGFMVMLNLANVLVQTQVPDRLRGRVMGVYALMVMGLYPVGALLGGTGAAWIGAPAMVALTALVALAFAAWLWLRRPQVRGLE